jgi:uncharacterized membrane protein YphA (DoxX/SURF4 family)
MKRKFAGTSIIIIRLLAAVILLQTLLFKFTAAEESVYIFSTLGMEPGGRIAIGVLELVASVLLLVPNTTVYGALLAAGLMTGAIYFHLTKLGLTVQSDGGQLFIYALVVLICSMLLLIVHKKQIPGFGKRQIK